MTVAIAQNAQCRIRLLSPQLVRHVITRAYGSYGNLQLVDCIGLTAEAVRHFYFYYRLTPGPLRTDDIFFWDQVSLWNVIRAVPDLAQATGFLPKLFYGRLGPRSCLWFALRREIKWTKEILHPSFEAYRGARTPDLTCRLGEVAFHWEQTTLHSALLHDTVDDIRQVSRAVRRNVGDLDVEDAPSLTGPQSAEWVHLVCKNVPFEQAFEIDHKGVVRMSGRALAIGFKETLGTGARKHVGELSLDEWIAQKNERHGGETSIPSGREAQPVDVALLRELRDLVDQSRECPLIADMAARLASLGQSDLREGVDRLHRLLDLLRSTTDRPLQAALVFENGRDRARQHGALSKSEVSQAFGVSARQIDRRCDKARGMLHRQAG